MNLDIKEEKIMKILTVIIAMTIIGYLIVSLIINFDFSDFKKIIGDVKTELSIAPLIEYLDNHEDYYYKINGAEYCISKEELISSSEISTKFTDSMEKDYILATYQNGYTFSYVESCEQ